MSNESSIWGNNTQESEQASSITMNSTESTSNSNLVSQPGSQTHGNNGGPSHVQSSPSLARSPNQPVATTNSNSSSRSVLRAMSLSGAAAIAEEQLCGSSTQSPSAGRSYLYHTATVAASNCSTKQQNPLNPNPNLIHDGEINHFARLSQDFAALYLNQELSDVIFVVNGERFASHRVILASRSEYFRVLLFGSFKESQSCMNELVIEDTTALAFGALLKYIYTGKLTISEYSEADVLDILGLAHKYRFELLEESISSYLNISLTIENVCLIYDDSLLYNLTTLTKICKEFLDLHASEAMKHPTFLNLSLYAICELIQRDSFYAPELEIFNAVYKWRKHNFTDLCNPNGKEGIENCRKVISKVRLTLISLKDLLDIVRPSGLYTAEDILDAIKLQSETSDINLQYRGCILPDENVAHQEKQALVIQGEMKDRMLDGGDNLYIDSDVGHSRHLIDDKECLVILLGKHYIINTIKLLLWDKDHRSYSFYIEVSVNEKEWVRVCDYSNYLCRSMQLIQFQPRVVRFIRVVGVHNTVNKSFHVVNLQCMFSTQDLKINDEGFVCPVENVASTKQHASVAEGVSRSRNALINGDTENYDWDMGYTCHQLGSGAIVIQLCQPFCLSSMRMLLWDCDARSYSYYIEISNDQKHWTRICDRTKEDCRGWQYATFEPVIGTFIKLVGTRNTANEVFHVVHFETPAVTFSSEEERRSLTSGEQTFLNVTPNPNL